MDFNFNTIFTDLEKVINSASANLTTEQKVQVNQFRQKSKNFFKDVDLTDVSKIDINSLNLKLEELKKMTDGFTDNK